MDRRELLAGMAAMVAAATAGRAFAAGEHDHMDMGMEGMNHEGPHQSARNDKLIAAAENCVTRANVCLQHCLVRLGEGDTKLAGCAATSSEVMAMCGALLQMAAAESKHLPQLAKVAMAVCKDCEETCRKTKQHPECRACMYACMECYKECEALAA